MSRSVHVHQILLTTKMHFIEECCFLNDFLRCKHDVWHPATTVCAVSARPRLFPLLYCLGEDAAAIKPAPRYSIETRQKLTSVLFYCFRALLSLLLPGVKQLTYRATMQPSCRSIYATSCTTTRTRPPCCTTRLPSCATSPPCWGRALPTVGSASSGIQL